MRNALASATCRLIRSRDTSLPRDVPALSTTTKAWRKQQLDKLEHKLSQQNEARLDQVVSEIGEESDLQPMWQSMESRVKNRRSLTAQERDGKIGRMNVRRTDEDVWLAEGLYDSNSTGDECEKKT
jgi:hypothetical protein